MNSIVRKRELNMFCCCSCSYYYHLFNNKSFSIYFHIAFFCTTYDKKKRKENLPIQKLRYNGKVQTSFNIWIKILASLVLLGLETSWCYLCTRINDGAKR